MASNTELNIWIRLKDDASKALGGLNGKLESLEPTFKRMSVIGGAAFAGLSAVAIKSVRDFGEAEGIMRQLENTTINIAKGSMQTVDALSKLADQVQRNGVVDADAVRLGQAQLMTFQLSTEMVKGLTSSMADLAVNQFGVNASGEQFVQTANIMAKALRGEFGVLEKSGIVFTEVQKRMIEFGNEHERVTALNEGLRQNLRLTNEVALSTMDGQIAKLNATMGDISENIGAALTPAFTALFQRVAPLVEKFAEWSAMNPTVIASAIGIGGALSGITAAVGVLGLAIPAVTSGLDAIGLVTKTVTTNTTALAGGVTATSQAMTVALTPLGLWIAAAAILVGSLVLLYNKSETFRNAINGIVEAIGGMISSFASFLESSVEVQFLVDTLKRAFDSVAFVVTNFLWPALQKLWATVSTELMPAIGGLFTALAPLTPLLEFLAKVVGVILIAALWALIHVFTAVVIAVTGVLGYVTTLVNYLVGNAAAGISSFAAKVQWLTDKFSGLVDWIQRAIDKLNRLNAIQGAKNFLSNVGNFITGSRRANGGMVRAGHPYIVGERGPEVVVPGADGRINPGVGGTQVYVDASNSTFVGPRDLARQVTKSLMGDLNLQIKTS